jgi:RNA recognition motif-containing protein
VGNISPQVSNKDLEETLAKYGTIISINIKNNYAFVEYKDPKDADEAILGLNGFDYHGKVLNVEPSNSNGKKGRNDYRYPRKRNPHSKFSPPRNSDFRLIIENIPPNCNWKDLKDHFRCVGEVCFSDVRRNRSGKEYGVVEFKYFNEMKIAIRDMDQTKMHGFTIYISEDAPRRSPNFVRSRSPRRSLSRSPSRRMQRRTPSPDRYRGYSHRYPPEMYYRDDYHYHHRDRSVSPRGRRMPDYYPYDRRIGYYDSPHMVPGRRSLSPIRRSISPGRDRRSLSPVGNMKPPISPR